MPEHRDNEILVSGICLQVEIDGMADFIANVCLDITSSLL